MRYLATTATMIGMTLVFFSGPAFSAQQQEQTNQHQVEMVTGLNGASYEAYLPSLIEQTQEALKAKDYYSGPVNGVLDHDTMEAIGKFQKDNGLTVSGVPSPETREYLFSGQQSSNMNR
jgi:murein L,D-transpeptidase YcbB/YkuD